MSFKKIALSVICAFIMTMVVSTVTVNAEVTPDTAKEDYKPTVQNTASPDVKLSEVKEEKDIKSLIVVTATPAAMELPVQNAIVNEQLTEAWTEIKQPIIAPVITEQVPTSESTTLITDSETDNPIIIETGAESSSKKPSYTKAELRLMSAIIYCEAGSESYAGKLAVGIVIMNRKASSGFPNSIKGVIYQKRQFTPARSGALKRALSNYDADKFNSKLEKQCIKAAKEALSGSKSVEYKGKTKSFAKYKYFSGYIRRAKYRIGGHMFK